MPNAKDLPKTKKNIVVIGPTGTGKTQLFTTIPGKKLCYMFDPSGLETLRGHDVDYEFFPPDQNLGLRQGMKSQKDPKGPKHKEPLAYANFEDHLENMIANQFYDYDAIAFDSVTKLQEIVMDRQLWINSRYGQIPELGDYRIIGLTLMNIFSEVMTHQPTIYVTGHTDTVKDEVVGRVIDSFDTVKNLRRQLPRDVTDLWISHAESGSDKHSYKIQTRPDKRNPHAKNSMNLNFMEDVTLDPKKNIEEQGVGRFLKQQK